MTTFAIGTLLVTAACFIAIWLNDKLPGGNLPDDMINEEEKSHD